MATIWDQNGPFQAVTVPSGTYFLQYGNYFDRNLNFFGNQLPVTSGYLIVGQSAIPASVTGTTSEATLATISIPAGRMGPNGRLRVWALVSATNNANAKTLNIRLDGTLMNAGQSLANAASFQGMSVISNRGATNSQISNGSLAFSNTSATNVATAIDTTQTQSLTITGTLGTSSDTLTLEAWGVEALNP